MILHGNTDSKNTTKPIIITAVVSGILTAAICAVMNFILIPRIESGASMRCFDMSFGYSYLDALDFLRSISEQGRAVYLGIQLPLDFVYPIVYCVFFISVFRLLFGKSSSLYILPIMLAVFDVLENICTLIMLKGEQPSLIFVSFASSATMLKTVLMYICLLSLLVLVIMTVAIKHRQKETVQSDN